MVATAKVLMSTPIQRAMRAGGKMSPRMACTIGMIAPAPSPCSARKAISSFIEWDCPLRAEPTTKMIMPRMKKRLRP